MPFVLLVCSLHVYSSVSKTSNYSVQFVFFLRRNSFRRIFTVIFDIFSKRELIGIVEYLVILGLSLITLNFLKTSLFFRQSFLPHIVGMLEEYSVNAFYNI